MNSGTVGRLMSLLNVLLLIILRMSEHLMLLLLYRRLMVRIHTSVVRWQRRTLKVYKAMILVMSEPVLAVSTSLYTQDRRMCQRHECRSTSKFVLSLLIALASPAVGHWGTYPLHFQLFKMVNFPWLCPGPRWASLQCSPRPPSLK